MVSLKSIKTKKTIPWDLPLRGSFIFLYQFWSVVKLNWEKIRKKRRKKFTLKIKNVQNKIAYSAMTDVIAFPFYYYQNISFPPNKKWREKKQVWYKPYVLNEVVKRCTYWILQFLTECVCYIRRLLFFRTLVIFGE